MTPARNQPDIGTGLFFIGFGVLTVVLARRYALGTASSMGPGYFPTLLGGLLALVGVIVLIKGLRGPGEKLERAHWRPYIVLGLAIAAFGALIQGAGLALAVAATAVISAFAGQRARIAETLILAVCLSAISVLVFIVALKLSLRLWP